jgi:hypothetical protein
MKEYYLGKSVETGVWKVMTEDEAPWRGWLIDPMQIHDNYWLAHAEACQRNEGTITAR